MYHLLLSLLIAPSAHARDWNVPSGQPTVAEAINVASSGDRIVLDPGAFNVISNQIEIGDRNGTRPLDITITGPFPPREVDDPDVVEDSILWLDVELASDPLFNPGFKGAFVVNKNSRLTFQNIQFKQQESICNDRLDNDGNGLADDQDPICDGQNTDTSTSSVGALAGTEGRAFFVERDGELIIDHAHLQGWSWAVEGNVIFAQNAGEVTIRDSVFVYNRGLVELLPSGGFRRSRGIVYTIGTPLTVERSYFNTNEHRYGGALYATDDSIVNVTDNVFYACAAEDGGAILVESSSLTASRNTFVENTANNTPGQQLWVNYEGGAIYAEDALLQVYNNIFMGNSALDHGASIYVRRNLGGVDPDIQNNTFVRNGATLFGGASVMFDDTSFKYHNNISFQEFNGIIGSVNWNLGSVPDVKWNDFWGVDRNNIFVAELSGVEVNQVQNVFADPLFAYFEPELHFDWDIWRFWLQPTSPAIDAGDPTKTDVGGSRLDIGAFGGALSGAIDADGDGWTNIYDCDDDDENIRPYAEELCDDVDNDCNGIVDDQERILYEDLDFDGFGAGEPISTCPGQPLQPTMGIWVEIGGDCDDNNVLVSPGRVEFCDLIDNDCDGDADEGIPVRQHYIDTDGDGFGNPDPTFAYPFECPPNGYSPFPTDCNDNDANIHPLIDEDAQIHLPLASKAIERNEADRDPGFVADGIDQDCNLVDLCYADLDRDGFGAEPVLGGETNFVEDNDRNCRNLSAFTAATGGDCDDRDARSFPGAEEVPGDFLDQNCDGHDDCYQDLDGDGWGNENIIVPDTNVNCSDGSSGGAAEAGDCNDDPQSGGAEINPSVPETCDAVDNNCDGNIDEVSSGDAETYYLDADGDGVGNIQATIEACGQPIGYSAVPGDCNDDEPNTFPGNLETCDGIDNNCESGIDEDSAIDVTKWYEDLDGDGFGNADLSASSCEEPTDGGPWVRGGKPLDCNDAEPTVGPCPNCGNCASINGNTSFGGLFLLLAVGALRRRED